MNTATLLPLKKSVLTGFPDLDVITGGLGNGDLIVMAARPGVGKTTLAANIAEHVALNQKLQVAIFSIGMDATSFGRHMTNSTSPNLFESAKKLRSISIHIDDTADLTLSILVAKARTLHKEFGEIGLLIVDYLQLMNGHETEAKNRSLVVDEMMSGLKLLAKELQCPVMVLSQVSRKVETREDKRPIMGDLREWGVLEQYADIVMFIYRDDYYVKDDSAYPGVVEIIIAKNRNGPIGTVKLAFDPSLTKHCVPPVLVPGL